MSYWQERIWSFSRTPEQSASYTMSRTHRIQGPLDARVLCDCINEVARRHEILRTTFALIGDCPAQIVHAPVLNELPCLDVTGSGDPESQAREICKGQASWLFDLSRGPLWRFLLIRLRENEYWLFRVAHHIIFDNHCWNIFFRELALLYAARLNGDAASIPEPKLQYGDYAVWQRGILRRGGPAYKDAVAWWQNYLSDAPQVLSLPFQRRRPVENVIPTDGVIRWGIDPKISEQLNAMARMEGATLYTVRLAAFILLLSAAAGMPDVILGIYLTNRKRVATRNMLAYFANLATLRLLYEPKKSFREWLAIVRARLFEVEAHGDIPYEKLREEFEQAGKCLPQIAAIFHVSQGRRPIEFARLKLSWMEQHFESMPWGFTMNVDDESEEHNCRTTFDARVYDAEGVRDFVERYKRLLVAVSSHPDSTLDGLLMLSCTGASPGRERRSGQRVRPQILPSGSPTPTR
jgi:Condensation domain